MYSSLESLQRSLKNQMRKPHANWKQTVFIDNFKSDLKFGNKSKHFSHENQKNKQFYHLKLFY